MKEIIFLIIIIILGIICAFLHKKNGYSPIAGFCWGFFFSAIGLAIVLLEEDKNQLNVEGKIGLSMGQWLLTFIGIGILLILIAFMLIGII